MTIETTSQVRSTTHAPPAQRPPGLELAQLQNGQVLVAGGESFAKHAPTGLVSAELYTP